MCICTRVYVIAYLHKMYRFVNGSSNSMRQGRKSQAHFKMSFWQKPLGGPRNTLRRQVFVYGGLFRKHYDQTNIGDAAIHSSRRKYWEMGSLPKNLYM